MNKIILHGCNEVDADEHFHSVLALDKHFVGISTNVSSLVTCVKEMVEEHHGNDEFVNEETPECEETTQIEKKGHHYKRKHVDHSGLPNITLYASLGLVAVMFAVGSVWDLIKANNLLQNEKGDIS